MGAGTFREGGLSSEELIQLPAYGLKQSEKEALYGKLLTDLTREHGQKCLPYGRFLRAAGVQEKLDRGEVLTEEEIPFLPVSVFKERALRSVPQEQVFKELTSSGTSGQKTSRIFLDADTSAVQQKVLYRIVSDYIGADRVPYLVLDTEKVLKDRSLFSARGAGILGFSIFSSQMCFALNEKMELNLEEVQAFLDKNKGKTILLFGFTFMIWEYFVRALEKKGVTLSIPGGVLIHGGGWKKMADRAVTSEEFKEGLRRTAGITKVSNYYGMAEQTGCIYMECECGYYHASTWSDVLMRRPKDYSVCGAGEPGLIQVMTPIARSYPGHSLLTEDIGTLLGTDDCPCGRKGKYFTVTGRAPRAEVRGCSDTYGG